MKIKYFLSIIFLINLTIFCSELQEEIDSKFKMIRIDAKVEVDIFEIIPFDKLSSEHAEKCRNIQKEELSDDNDIQNDYIHRDRNLAIRVIKFKELYARNLSADTKMLNFDFNLIDIFKIEYLPLYCVFDFDYRGYICGTLSLSFKQTIAIGGINYDCLILLQPSCFIPDSHLHEHTNYKVCFVNDVGHIYRNIDNSDMPKTVSNCVIL